MPTPQPSWSGQWIVTTTDRLQLYAWGPFPDKEQADKFASFVTAEIDPAESRPLRSPLNELLSYYDYRTGQADH